MFRYRTLALAAFITLTTFPAAGHARPAQRGRLAPPSSVTCPSGKDLTVYEGRITTYRRTSTNTVLRIRTDYDTNESVTLRYRRGVNPARWFLLNAERFRQSDWERIELRPGRLLPRMRANIWVCSDGSNPIVDWRPPTE